MFLTDARREWGIDPDRIEEDALAVLREYAWPGERP
jgi:DNA-binding NtrC family response regulator